MTPDDNNTRMDDSEAQAPKGEGQGADDLEGGGGPSDRRRKARAPKPADATPRSVEPDPKQREQRLAEARGALVEEEELRDQRPSLVRRLRRWFADRRERAARRRGELAAESTAAPAARETPVSESAVLEAPIAATPRAAMEEAQTAKSEVQLESPAGPPAVEPDPPPAVPGAEAAAPPVPKRSLFPRSRRAKGEATAVEAEDTKIREIALEGYDDAEPEPAPPEAVSLDAELQRADKQIRTAVRELRGPERRLLVGLLIGIAVIGVFAGVYLGASAIRVAMATPVPQHASITVPEPTRLELPGGWSFILAKGSAVDGKWQPEGAEWLAGTEVCRWVSLPWSLQLEAVVRTLAPGDEMLLTMSNTDQLLYRVQSIREIDVDDIGRLTQNSPCLHTLLTNPRSGSRWVVTAVP